MEENLKLKSSYDPSLNRKTVYTSTALTGGLGSNRLHVTVLRDQDTKKKNKIKTVFRYSTEIARPGQNTASETDRGQFDQLLISY